MLSFHLIRGTVPLHELVICCLFRLILFYMPYRIFTEQTFYRWLHLESNAAGRNKDTVLHMKLDEIKEQIIIFQGQQPTKPRLDAKTSLAHSFEEHELPALLKNESEKLDDGFQTGGNDYTETSSLLKAELESENLDFRRTLDDCVQSAHEFISSTHSVMGSRASGAGSTQGFGMASDIGEALTRERRLGIEDWIAEPVTTGNVPIGKAGIGSPEATILSHAEKQFVEICEEVEQLGRNDRNEEAAVIGMRYLDELWEQYGPRLHEQYTSSSYKDAYMTDEMHGQQLRRDILESKGIGFMDPERSLKGTYTILHFFAHIGCLAEFRLLLIRTNVDPNLRDHVRKTPLIRAAHMGHESVVAYLLERPGIAVNTPDKHGYTALDYATIHNHTDVVGMLLDHLEKEPVRDRYYIHRPFQLAARYGRLSVMKVFVSRAKVDVNYKGDDRETALHIAIIEDQFAIVQYLLTQPHIDVGKTNGREETPLLCAARHQRRYFLNDVLDHPGVNVNQCGRKGRTTLYFLAACGDKDLVTRLLRKGADPNIADSGGIFPITYAASKCYVTSDKDIFYPRQKERSEEHLELIEVFLTFYNFKRQPPDVLHRYVKLCTQCMESTREGKTPFSDLDLSARWFKTASSSYNGEYPEQTPSHMRSKTFADFENPLLSKSLTSLTLGDKHEGELKPYAFEAILNKEPNENTIPESWLSLFDPRLSTSRHELFSDLFSIKTALDIYCFHLQNKDMVSTSHIITMKTNLEERITSFLKYWPRPVGDCYSTIFSAFAASSPEEIIAKAMLWQQRNAVFVLSPHFSRQSRLVSLACGNRGERIRDRHLNTGGFRLFANIPMTS